MKTKVPKGERATEMALNEALAEVDRLQNRLNVVQCKHDELVLRIKHIEACQKAEEQGRQAYRNSFKKDADPYAKNVPLSEKDKALSQCWVIGWETQRLDQQLSSERKLAIKAVTNALTTLRLEVSKTHKYDADETKRKKEVTVKELEVMVGRFNSGLQ